MESPNINSENYKFMRELEEKQVSQPFPEELSVHTYKRRDQRVGQVFRITFEDIACPPTFLNATNYSQHFSA